MEEKKEAKHAWFFLTPCINIKMEKWDVKGANISIHIQQGDNYTYIFKFMRIAFHPALFDLCQFHPQSCSEQCQTFPLH